MVLFNKPGDFRFADFNDSNNFSDLGDFCDSCDFSSDNGDFSCFRNFGDPKMFTWVTLGLPKLSGLLKIPE